MSVHDDPHDEDGPAALQWFGELVGAMARLDRPGAEHARRKLAFRGWRVWHRCLPDFYRVVTDHELCAFRRRMLRIWDIARLTSETVEAIGQWVSTGVLPPPTIYDELGPAWERVEITAWNDWRTAP